MPTIEAVVIGASAGAIEALLTILPALPADFPVPVIVVIHIPADRDSIVAEVLQNKCDLRVKEAEDTETMERGTVYIAPPAYHLLIEPDRRLSLSVDEPVLFSRPSIDVLFESAADAIGDGLLGVILTGASNDGAQGLRSILDQGGTTIVQDPVSAYASAMPKAALESCPTAQKLELKEIPGHIRQIVAGGRV
jgi:two-component system chemotaxis response regulator CheB